MDAREGEAAITVRATVSGVEVDVTDEGVGFDATRVAGPLGFDSSIMGRLVEVGGSATVESSPGYGTAVKITWACGVGRGAGLAGPVGELLDPLLLADHGAARRGVGRPWPEGVVVDATA